MAATWNVKRKLGSASKPDAGALKNLGVVRASEAKVLELAQEKAGDEGDETRRGFYQEAISELEKAIKELAAAESDGARIAAAVGAERSAYDALTHVVPSSYMMKKSRNPNAGEMEEKTRQMSNLDFAKQEDRYQSKSEAMGEKEREERSQTEELLAQLRALARRQEEVIERMRELESRVRDSVDEKERDAAKRELKKLTDEQQALARELENTQQKAAE
jgi:DNA-binding ferritin-like protein